jgi:tripartite motif-containing protein 71
LSLAWLSATEGEETPVAAPPFLLEWGKRGKAHGEFDIPIGLAMTRDDQILVSEFRNNRVQRFSAAGRFLAAYDVGEAAGGIAVDASGVFYVAHLMPGYISVHDPSGKEIRRFAKPGKGPGEFNQPGGIALAKDGTIYIKALATHIRPG